MSRPKGQYRNENGEPRGGNYSGLAEYYNHVYSYDAEFNKSYKSCRDYEVWKQVASLIDRNSSILEIGCGTGQLASLLNAGGYYKYVGIDISRAAINKALLHVPSEFYCESIFKSARLSNCYFNTVIACNVLEFTSDMQFIKRICPGSQFVFTIRDHHLNPRNFTFKTVADIYLRYQTKIEISQVKYIDNTFIINSLIPTK